MFFDLRYMEKYLYWLIYFLMEELVLEDKSCFIIVCLLFLYVCF